MAMTLVCSSRVSAVQVRLVTWYNGRHVQMECGTCSSRLDSASSDARDEAELSEWVASKASRETILRVELPDAALGSEAWSSSLLHFLRHC